MKTILVGLDGSARSEGVLAGAIELAQRLGASLMLFRAVSMPVALPAEAFIAAPTELDEILWRDAKKYLDELAQTVPPSVRCVTKVAVGTSWKTICDTALAEGADLIIIGAHGYGLLDRIIGTTASRIVNHAHCSVMVVREAAVLAKERAARPARATPVSPILSPAD